jgi:hypothetical protein
MKKGFRQQLEAKKHRVRRHAGGVIRDIGRVILLTGTIAVVAASLLIGYDWIIRCPCLPSGTVRGCKELTERRSDLAVRCGEYLTVNPGAITRRIGQSWIARVHRTGIPDRRVIMVRERTAVALLQREGGSTSSTATERPSGLGPAIQPAGPHWILQRRPDQ